jgi:hypothetical protein
MEQMGVMPEGLPGGAAATKGEAGAAELGPSARIQMLATEHWSLLATRSLSWSEAFSRSSMFLSALTGTVVALALVAQALPGEGILVFALLLLPVVLFLGVATFARLVAINNEDIQWVIGMNRIRHAYVELAPELEQYFVSGIYDDVPGVMKTFAATAGPGQFIHHFVTTPGMVAVIDGVIAGVLAGVVSGFVGASQLISIGVGAVAFVVTIGVLLTYQDRSVARLATKTVPRFPGPSDIA